MKFFFKQLKKQTFLKKSIKLKLENNSIVINGYTTPDIFKNFLKQNGLGVKSSVYLSSIIKNFNFFLYSNSDYINNTFPGVRWIVDDVLDKKLNYTHVFDLVVNLIKPPFVVKSVLIPKKLRKKVKQKYLIKIVYKNESKRLKSTFKQLYYYSNKFPDNKFQVRLYKAISFSFLEWKNSYLFKLKSMVFKKYFKF